MNKDNLIQSFPTKRQMKRWQQYLIAIFKTPVKIACTTAKHPLSHSILGDWLALCTDAYLYPQWLCTINGTTRYEIREWIKEAGENERSPIGIELKIPWTQSHQMTMGFAQQSSFIEETFQRHWRQTKHIAPHPLVFDSEWWCFGMTSPFETYEQRTRWQELLASHRVFLPDDACLLLSPEGCHLFFPFKQFACRQGTSSPFSVEWCDTREEWIGAGEWYHLHFDFLLMCVVFWEAEWTREQIEKGATE